MTSDMTGWRRFCLAVYGGASVTVMLAFASRIISFAGSAAAGIACGTVCSLLPAGQFGGPRKQSGSRVRQPEYQLHIFWIVWVMLYVCVHTSVKLSTTCAAIPSCQASLVPAMQPIQVLLSIRGHSSIAMRDDSDLQWRFFRSHLPLLLPAALLFVGVRRLITYLSGLVHGSKPSTAGTLLAYVILNLSVLVALFGMKGAIAMVAIAAGNYVLCLRMQQRQNTTAAVAMTWIYGLLVLFVNEWGVPEPLGTYFNEVVAIVSSSSLASNVLPHWDGLIPRWWVYWGPTMLRCVAFNHDWLWARQAWARKEEKTGLVDAKGGEKNFDAAAGGSSDARGDSVRNENHSASKWEFIPGTSARSLVPYSYDWRDRAHPPLHCFGLTAYFAYCFYAPALLAGPITSFSAFISHVYMPQRSHSSGALLQYGARLAFCLVVLELLSCCIPAFAVSSHLGEPAAAANLGPLDLTLFAYIMLKLIWLKFTIIWRFFRLWALLDGVELPENMARCMSNNFTLAGFWQGWHCSFNQWCVRYLYIPLGGRKHRIRNVFVTFTFVALWHDMTMQLLAWGWLSAFFFLPESLASALFRGSDSLRTLTDRWWFPNLVAFGGAANILTLVIANLIGFSVGLTGAAQLAEQLVQRKSETMLVLLGTAVTLYNGVLLMLELRIDRKSGSAARDGMAAMPQKER